MKYPHVAFEVRRADEGPTIDQRLHHLRVAIIRSDVEGRPELHVPGVQVSAQLDQSLGGLCVVRIASLMQRGVSVHVLLLHGARVFANELFAHS